MQDLIQPPEERAFLPLPPWQLRCMGDSSFEWEEPTKVMGSSTNYRSRAPIIGRPCIFICSIIGRQHGLHLSSFPVQNWYCATPPRSLASKTTPYQLYLWLFNFCMCLIQITNNAKYNILTRFLEANADIFTPEMLPRPNRILRQSEDQHTPSLTRVHKKNQLK